MEVDPAPGLGRVELRLPVTTGADEELAGGGADMLRFVCETGHEI